MYLCNWIIITLSTSSLCIFQTGTEVIISLGDISGILVCVGSEGGAPQLSDFLTECYDPTLSTEHLFLSLHLC